MDKNANERQSDGVEFCIIPEFHNNKIYFYCSEYALFWNSIETVGDFNKTLDIILKERIIPATLDEIADNDLIHYIDTVKEYDTDTKK
ncbi:hypothetical protein [Gilliamella sp. wkB112]|uniref:hypothetical protein n=1 Tax=Gilliamella sp. wkB112 TaxID=3120257 RepID=UPI001C3FFBC7|nr:hypothetical protein [Gilliamella apicola]